MKFSHLFALSTLGTFAIAQDELVDIPTTAANAGSFATLLAAIQAAGLGETLSGEGPFTVFAPTDAAFTDIDQALVACLLAQPEALTAVLTYHVLPASVKSSAITGAMEATTVNGEPLMIDVVNGTGVVLNGDVTVITADILATNGVIHVIDDVLIPPNIDIAAFSAGCAALTIPPTEPSAGAHSVSTKMFLSMAAALSLVVAVAM